MDEKQIQLIDKLLADGRDAGYISTRLSMQGMEVDKGQLQSYIGSKQSAEKKNSSITGLSAPQEFEPVGGVSVSEEQPSPLPSPEPQELRDQGKEEAYEDPLTSMWGSMSRQFNTTRLGGDYVNVVGPSDLSDEDISALRESMEYIDSMEPEKKAVYQELGNRLMEADFGSAEWWNTLSIMNASGNLGLFMTDAFLGSFSALAGTGLSIGSSIDEGRWGDALQQLGILGTSILGGAGVGFLAAGPGGAIGGGARGAMGAASALTDMSITVDQLIREELGTKPLTDENLALILRDEEIRSRIRNKAVARSATIGVADALTMGAAQTAVRSVGKTVKGVAIGGGIEAAGGAGGELAAQVISGDEVNMTDVLLEGILEGPMVAVDVATVGIGTPKSPSYVVNGEPVSREAALSFIESGERISNVKIENDPALEEILSNTVKGQKQTEVKMRLDLANASFQSGVKVDAASTTRAVAENFPEYRKAVEMDDVETASKIISNAVASLQDRGLVSEIEGAAQTVNTSAMANSPADSSAPQVSEKKQKVEEYQKQAEKATPENKKDIEALATSLQSEVEAMLDEREQFYDMVFARHPEKANQIQQLDTDILKIKKQIQVEGIDPSMETALSEELTRKTQERAAIEQSVQGESTQLSSEEKSNSVASSAQSYKNSIDSQIEDAKLRVDEATDLMSTEMFDPAPFEIAQEELNQLNEKKEEIELLVEEYDALKDLALEEAQSIGQMGVSEDLKAVEDQILEIEKKIGQVIGKDFSRPSTARGAEAVDVKGYSSSDQVSYHTENGGSTFGLDGTNYAGAPKAAVSLFNERTKMVDGQLTEEALSQYIQENQDILSGNEDVLVVGSWFNEKTNQTELDVSVVLDKDEAVRIGKEFNQQAVWDLEHFKEIDTEGDGKAIEGLGTESERIARLRGLLSEEKVQEQEPVLKDLTDIEEDLKSTPIDQVVVDNDESIVVPIAKDGSPGLRAGQAGLSADEVKYINNLVKYIRNVIGDVPVKIHPNAASGIAHGLRDGEGGQFNITANEIHISPEVIKKNMEIEAASEIGDLISRRKTFKETVQEEVMHAVLLGSVEKMNTGDLISFADRAVSVASTDVELTKRIVAKAYNYSGKAFDLNTIENDPVGQYKSIMEGLSEQKKREVSEEVFIELLSAIAGDQKVNLSTLDKIRLLINEFIIRKFGGAGLEISKNSDLIKIAANFKAAAKTGRGANVSVTEGSMVSSKSSRPLSPAKIPANKEGKIVVTMGTPIYRWSDGIKKDIGSQRITKEFNDVWHFINWWKKATKNGEESNYYGFKTEDGTAIDVDRINGYNIRSSRGIRQFAAGTDIGRRVAGRVYAAQKQGILPDLIAKRIMQRLRMAEAKAARSQNIGSNLTDKYYELINNIDVQSKRLIEERADQMGKSFSYYPDNPDTRSSFGAQVQVKAEKERVEQVETFARVANQFAGRTDLGKYEAIGRQALQEILTEVAGFESSDTPSQRIEKALPIMIAVWDDLYFGEGRQEIIDKYFKGKDPLDFYRNAHTETYELVDHMIMNGETSLSRNEAMTLINLIMGIVSQRSDNINNTLAATILFYLSEQSRKRGGQFIDENLINRIERNPKEAGEKFGFVNGMVGETVAKNLRLLNTYMDMFKRADGGFNHTALIEFLSSEVKEGEIVADSFGPKVGKFGLNLNGVDKFDTFDSHVINNMKTWLGLHVDFERMYNGIEDEEGRIVKGGYKYKIAEETGLDAEDTPSEEMMRELKQMIHETEDSTERNRLRRMYYHAMGIPESPKINNEERAMFEEVVSLLSKRYKAPRRSIVQLFFADHQVYSVNPDTESVPYNEFSIPLANIREKGLYKISNLSDAMLRIGASLEEKSEMNYRSNLQTTLEASVSDEVRSSNQLQLFSDGSQNAEESPLFRRRTVEEVGKTRDGDVMTPEVIDQALSTDAVSKRVRAKGNVISEGQPVGVRLNLNVLKNTGVPVQTLHDKTASGEALDYSGAVMVKNPTLYVNQSARKKIFTFQENKFPMASVNGGFLTSDITQMSFDGVKAFFNPFKQNVFVDAAGRPIKSAEEATVVGNHVYLRGKIEYYSASDPIIAEGFMETPAQKEKRTKRGPKYDKALDRFAAYSAGNGVQFSSREDLMEAYDNMPITSKVALDESQVAQNMEEAMIRASSNLKMRRTAGRAARRYPGVRKEIIDNPNNYFTPQSIKELKLKLKDMSTADLVSIMSNDGLGRLQDRNDDLGVLASAELVNRAIASDNIEAIPDIIEEAAAMGTTAGRILRHLRELKGSTPKGIELIILGAIERKGNTITDEQKTRLQKMAADLFRAGAEHEELMKRAIAGEDVEAELKAKTEEVKAIERDLETFCNSTIERGWGELGGLLIQGNLLTPMSQITNVGANMVNALSKVAVDAIALPVERMVNMFGIESPMKRNYSINAYMYGVRKFGTGFIEAIDQIKTGQESDVSEWRMNRGFAPFRSLMAAMGKGDLPMGADGKTNLSTRAKLFVQGTLGIPAEVMFRFLTLGDTPFRRYVEGIELYQIGRNQGLEGDALKNFIKFPDKRSMEMAMAEGKKLTYQEETVASRTADDFVKFVERITARFFDWIPGTDGNAMARFLIRSNIPYRRTPANILYDTLTFATPYVAIPRMMAELKNGDARSASQTMAKAMIGGMATQVTLMMIREGIISGAIEWNEDEEKNMAYDQFPPNSINISALKRWMAGGDATKQPDDYFVSYMKLGILGTVMGSVVKGVDKEELKKREYSGDQWVTHVLQDSFGIQAFSSIAHMMDQSFVQGMNNLVQVLSTGDERTWENWLKTTFQAMSATVLPNTLSAFYRAERDYLPDTRITKDMSFGERVLKSFEYTIKSRTFGLGEVPIRRNWKGEPIEQTPRGTSGIAYQLFDITKARQGEADAVSNEIWRLYEQTEKLTKVCGTPGYAEKRKLNVPNIKAKHLKMLKEVDKSYTWMDDEEFMADAVYLNTEQINRMMEASGKERYMEVEAFMETEEYNAMDNEERIEALDDINDNYNSAIEINAGRFRNHTMVLFDIMQEIYDSER